MGFFYLFSVIPDGNPRMPAIRVSPDDASYISLMIIHRNMADIVKKTGGTRAMNAFPTIAFLITIGLAVVIYMGIL